MEKSNAIPKLMTFNWLPDEIAFVINFYPLFIEFFSNQLNNPGRLVQDFLARNQSFLFDITKKEQGI